MPVLRVDFCSDRAPLAGGKQVSAQDPRVTRSSHTPSARSHGLNQARDRPPSLGRCRRFIKGRGTLLRLLRVSVRCGGFPTGVALPRVGAIQRPAPLTAVCVATLLRRALGLAGLARRRAGRRGGYMVCLHACEGHAGADHCPVDYFV